MKSISFGPVLVFRFLLSAVLKERREHDGVGCECCQEDVERCDEGADWLRTPMVDDHGELVEGEDYTEEGQGKTDDNGYFPKFVNTGHSVSDSRNDLLASRKSGFQDHGDRKDDDG